ncbi:MAG: hypothetical protein AAB407_00230 [Patescibacteria group bacterium]
MPAKSAFSIVGLAHKVCLVAEGQGYTPELMNALAERPDLFKQLLQVQLGNAEIRIVDHVVDCDVDPMIPDGWKIEDHQKGGQWKWDPAKVNLFLSDPQKEGKTIRGTELRKQLQGQPVLNACVLDYLLAHPYLIPEDWKQDDKGRTRYTFFWGTIYRHSNGNLGVRYLYWDGGRWDWSCRWLDDGWDGQDPAALRA